MVLDPLIVSNERTCRFSRVLINGGSNLNLLYRSLLEKLGIRECDMRPTTTTFHGVLPGPRQCRRDTRRRAKRSFPSDEDP